MLPSDQPNPSIKALRKELQSYRKEIKEWNLEIKEWNLRKIQQSKNALNALNQGNCRQMPPLPIDPPPLTQEFLDNHNNLVEILTAKIQAERAKKGKRLFVDGLSL